MPADMLLVTPVHTDAYHQQYQTLTSTHRHSTAHASTPSAHPPHTLNTPFAMLAAMYLYDSNADSAIVAQLLYYHPFHPDCDRKTNKTGKITHDPQNS